MIDFSNGYSYADILADMLGQVDDSLDKREGSLIQTALGPGAWYMEGLVLLLAQIQSGAYAQTATGTDLDMLAATRGLTRNAATPAVRQGTFDAVIPAASQFRTINGANSVTFTSGALISSGGGVYVYELTCDTPGSIGNSYTGQLLPVTAILGLTTATIGAIITEGVDTETDTSLRERYNESFSAAPYGGNISEYRQAILAQTGVGGVQVYPASYYNGGGTVLCSIIDTDLGEASQLLVDAVQAAICPNSSALGVGIAPIGAAVDIVSASELTVDVEADITFEAGIVNGLQVYGDAIREAIDEYIKSVAQAWGTATYGVGTISYNVTVYAARVIYAILSVPHVVNVQNLTLNGSAGDLTLTETSALQQVPVLGEVTLNE